MRPKGSKAELEARRRRAVGMVRSGRGVSEVAHLVGVCSRSVSRWMRAYEVGGEAGLGYDFVVPEGVDNPDPEHKKVLKDFFDSPNEEMTWGEVLENVLTDFEALGNGYFEVVRNRFGRGAPRSIYHVPAVTMRAGLSGDRRLFEKEHPVPR